MMETPHPIPAAIQSKYIPLSLSSDKRQMSLRLRANNHR